MLDQYLTPAVKKIFLINVIVGILLIVFGSLTGGAFVLKFVLFFSLYPPMVLRGCIWQFVTYMFVHAEVMHLVFNMFVLWFFAPSLESSWGSRRFWSFYLITGAGAGLIHFGVSLLSGYEVGPLIGASGALYGVMLAFAAYNPDSIVLVWGVFPIKVKYLVAILAFMTFLSTASGRESSVSNLTHLSGLLVAYVYLALYHREWDIRRWQRRRW